MIERELRAVAIALNEMAIELQGEVAPLDFRNKMAQAAISASDSKYVNGLVEALKHYEAQDEFCGIMKTASRATKALQNLPEDLRK